MWFIYGSFEEKCPDSKPDFGLTITKMAIFKFSWIQTKNNFNEDSSFIPSRDIVSLTEPGTAVKRETTAKPLTTPQEAKYKNFRQPQQSNPDFALQQKAFENNNAGRSKETERNKWIITTFKCSDLLYFYPLLVSISMEIF